MNELDPQQKGAQDLPESKDSPREVFRLRGFFIDPEGGLHRGVPIVVHDDEDNEILAFIEHNTGKIFPRVVPPEKGKSPAHP